MVTICWVFYIVVATLVTYAQTGISSLATWVHIMIAIGVGYRELAPAFHVTESVQMPEPRHDGTFIGVGMCMFVSIRPGSLFETVF